MGKEKEEKLIYPFIYLSEKRYTILVIKFVIKFSQLFL